MELTIYDRIINRKLNVFESFRVEMKYDSIASAFKFTFVFNPDDSDHKDMFVPGHFHICKLEHKGQRILTGYFLNQDFVDAPEPEPAVIEGYSLPGFLEDCEIYPSVEKASLRTIFLVSTPTKPILDGGYPLESNGLSLRQIVSKYIAPYRLKMIVGSAVESDMDLIYDETTAKETQSVASYLRELASQRNIVITHNEYGNLIFDRPGVSKKPVYHFDRENGYPAHTRMELNFNGKSIHSHIRILQQQDENEDVPSVESEIENPYVPYVWRPHVVLQSAGDSNSSENVAKNFLAKEMRNFRLKISIKDWDVLGQIFRPGDTISVTNRFVYLYTKTDWIIENVVLDGTPEKLSATMECVRPECYNGATMKYIYKGINVR
jgi:prophage tail gpP-like protein